MRIKNPQEKSWRQTYLVNCKQLDSFAKDIPKQFAFSSTIPPYTDKISKLLAQAQHSQLRLNKQQTTTFKSLADVVHDIDSLRSILKNYDQTNQYLVKVQNSSENILGKLENFRGKMGVAYEELAEQEENLNDELELLGKKIQAMGRGDEVHDQKENVKNNNKEVKVWQRNVQSAKGRVQNKVESGDNSRVNVLEERMKEKQRGVENIEKTLAVLGRNLGWPQEDHTDFISIWHRGPHKNYFQIEQQLQTYFAFYTTEQIQQHMNKYIKWKKLTEQKKELIVQYKNLKEQKKVQELKSLNLEREESKQKWQREQIKRAKQKEQAEMKAKLGSWKEKKEQQKKEEQQRKAQRQYERKQRQGMKRYEIEQRNKEMLELWKQQEAQKKEEKIRRIKSAKKPVPIDRQAEQRIRLRQQIALQKKLQIVNSRRQEQQLQRQKEQRIKESKYVKYSYVTSKLDKKTTAMKEKQREKFDGKEKKDANTFGGQLLMTGIRATPSWMK